MEIQTRIGKLLVKGMLLVVLLAAFTIFINLSWFDEQLHPDLVALSSPRSISTDDNSFTLIHGFSAANDKNMLAVGQAIIRNFRERYERGESITLSEQERDDLLGGSNLESVWRSDFQSLTCNSRLSVDCAGRLVAEIEQVDLNQPRLRLLLDRYEEILQTSRFEEIEETDAYTPFPRYGLVMQIARLRLAISYQRDTVEEFLAHVEEDINFWRMILRDGQSLIAKMVALAGFRNDLEYVSALIRLRDLSNSEIQLVRSLLHPLASDELDIGESFLAELRISVLTDNAMFAMLRDDLWLARVFSQRRATLNEYYLATVMPMRNRASLGAEAFYRQRGYDKLLYSVRMFPPPLYNLGGKLALKWISLQTSVQDYISRMHDVNGRVSLILLQVEIEQNPESGVDTIVKSSIHGNPYTGDPMHYDALAHTLGFDCLPGNSTDICEVAIGEVGR